jgi:uncharacterized protein Yka (UPF0111/DUF47 family)
MAAMFSLKRLFSSNDEFFALLASMSAQGHESAKALGRLTAGKAGNEALAALRQSRERERVLAAEIEELLCNSHPAPFGKDDVEPLARAVQAVPRSIRTFAERYNISRAHLDPMSFAPETAMLQTATDALHSLVVELRTGTRLTTAKTHNDTLQKIEGEMDDTVVNSIVQLYERTDRPIRAIVLKDLYELLDRTFDRCRTAGNLILRIAMKHS